MMLYYILKEGLEDKNFIAARTEGYDGFREQILGLNIDELERVVTRGAELINQVR